MLVAAAVTMPALALAGTPTAAAAPQAAAPAVPAAPAESPSTTPPDALVSRIEAGTDEVGDDDHDVARLTAAIGGALRAGDLVTAGTHLDTLQARLPARSLTLLRMQAWYAHANGDGPAALALYRSIVARLPGDATAAINLAILEAANGQPESARQRLHRLRRLDPESRRTEDAIDRLEAVLR